jgi:hypothetical protein
MQNTPPDFGACFETLREEPLPAYEHDPFLVTPGIEHRVGRIIAASAGHPKQTGPVSGGLSEFSILNGRASGC